MGKSPGKWIKSLLFGKKSLRPRSSKGRDALKSASEDAVSGGNGLPASTCNVSPVIPGSLPVSTTNPEIEKETPSRLGCNASPEPFKERIQQKNGAMATSAADNSEKSREDQAATMVQAAFRGYLARRAFHVLKGIIRLQALIRGHLVRRQAVSTIHSMLAIIKFQAVFRGHRVRASGSSVEVCSKIHAVVIKRMDSQEKLYAHKLVRKLLSSSIISLPLKIHYVQSEPNSSYSWMERWTFSGFWKSVLQPRKAIETKPHAKKSTYAMETESIRLKRNVRKSPFGGDAGSLSVTSDPEKPKRSIRKIYSPPLDTTTENQPSELEKVKRNLRKISSSILGADDGENGSESHCVIRINYQMSHLMSQMRLLMLQ
ncbi:hypothetical protein HPP92_008902 [Vanilla planifolia]|uniref:Uncharacterized protein n=1 Tax=Vanilla planifolia TaxID=51239 RepID=A0A835RIV9_VANPL|nr:hypothetical protein HPP92_008902 [Vanilla planifolia]